MNSRNLSHNPSTAARATPRHPSCPPPLIVTSLLSISEVRDLVAEAVGCNYSESSVRRWLSRHDLHPVSITKKYRGYPSTAICEAIHEDLGTDIVEAGITTSIITATGVGKRRRPTATPRPREGSPPEL